MVTFAVWPSWTLTISVSSTFTSAVISDMSAMVMMRGCGRVLDAGNHRLADAHRQIGDHAIQRRERVVLRQHVVEPVETRLRLR